MHASSLLRGHSVLIVEDSYLEAEANREVIERHGGRVIGPFPTTHQALSAALSERPTLALLDVDLDGTSSFLLADALNSLGIPFAFLTGQTATAAPARFGSASWISKPADDGAVLAGLATALSARD